MKKLFLAVFTLFTVVSLQAQPPAGDAAIGDVYGENFTTAKTTSAKNLEKQLKKEPSMEGQLKGKVIEVCPKKGCWIKLELENKTIATVKMKDYEFFVPTALEGKNIVIDGKAEMVTTTVAELRHIAEDAKKSKEEIAKITEPKEEIKIMANGIKVVK